jgi:O-methyltransferase
MTRNFEQLLQKYPIVSDQVDKIELSVLLAELEIVLARGTSGAIVEFGCYVGTTSLFIRRLLDCYQGNYDFHVYDSFEGLPPKTSEDMSVAGDQFVEGELHASRKAFIANFRRARLATPVIHKGWFSELQADTVPQAIMFAFLDGDYFSSINDSLALITPKLQPGAVVVIDDYMNEALPGAARAADAWAHRYNKKIRVQSSLGIIHW